MSPTARLLFASGFLAANCGCNWVIQFVPYQYCGPQRSDEVREPLEPLVVEFPPVSTGIEQAFRATAGCTLFIDVFHENSVMDDNLYPSKPEILVDQPYEVRVEPLVPDGRIDRGVLGYGQALNGRVVVETSIRNEQVTLTLFLPNPRDPDGIQEESVIIYLDPPE